MDILTTLLTNDAKYSKGQRRIRDFILNNYDKAAFMTAAKLGQATGVSESTVVRFAVELGFDGYPKMQRALEELVRTKLSSVQRLEIASDRMSRGDILRMVLLEDIDKIKITLDEVDSEQFKNVVDEILKAKNVYILGVRSASMLAEFLGLYLNLISSNVKIIRVNGACDIFEQLYRITEGDVIIGISFPRYSKRTLSALDYASSKGGKVIAITDSSRSPLVEKADYSLIARSDMASFADSLVAPLSLINALIVALGMEKKAEISNALEQLEKVWSDYETYDGDKVK